MRFIFSLAILSTLLLSCKDSNKISDQELMEQNVRTYFFMGDSVQLDIQITDTLHINDVEEIIANLQNNERLIQLDIDTLSLMIDDWNYKSLNHKNENNLIAADSCKIKALQFQLKQKELLFKQAEFNQTKRIFLHLKRSTWADISGFEASVHYEMENEVNDLLILMDANFNVVD